MALAPIMPTATTRPVRGTVGTSVTDWITPAGYGGAAASTVPSPVHASTRRSTRSPRNGRGLRFRSTMGLQYSLAPAPTWSQGSADGREVLGEQRTRGTD